MYLAGNNTSLLYIPTNSDVNLIYCIIVKNLIKGKGKAPQNGKWVNIWIGCTVIMVISLITAGIQSSYKEEAIKQAKLEAYHQAPEYKAKIANEKAAAEAQAKEEAMKKQQEERRRKQNKQHNRLSQTIMLIFKTKYMLVSRTFIK